MPFGMDSMPLLAVFHLETGDFIRFPCCFATLSLGSSVDEALDVRQGDTCGLWGGTVREDVARKVQHETVQILAPFAPCPLF